MTDDRREGPSLRPTGDPPSLPVVAPAGDGAGGPRLLVVTTVAATLRGFLAPYARTLRAHGWTVDAAARGARDDAAVVEAYDQVYDLPISRSILQVRSNATGFLHVVDLLGAGYDIVHVHTPIAGFLVRAASRRVPAGRRPGVVYTAHGFHFHRDGRPWTNALFLTAERVAGRWTDRLIVMNQEDLAAATRHRIVLRERLVFMPGIGVDTAYYDRSAIPPEALDAARTALGGDPTLPIVLMVGELNRNKRPEDLLAAAARMRRSDARIVFAGDGPGRAALETLAERLGVSARVSFLGLVTDVRPLMCLASALVLTSKREGLNRSIQEALALGLPVVASAARGNRDVVGDDAGVIVPIGDVDALAAALDRVLDDPEAARAMGRRGRARMVERHDLTTLLAQHEALYAELLASRTP